MTSEVERLFRAHNCVKEPWTVNWLREFVHPGDTFYDIGANVGVFSLIAAIDRGAVVVAVEPGFANFARLCENIELNQIGGRIIPIPLPLSNASELVSFKYRTTEPGQSRHGMRDDRWQPRDMPKNGRFVQPMLAIPLDELRATYRFPAPTHIKIDVDGAEVRVLKGAARTLMLPSLRSVLIQADAEQWDEACALLTGAGFSLATRVERSKSETPEYGLYIRDAGLEYDFVDSIA